MENLPVTMELLPREEDDQYPKNCLALLEGMPSGQAWTPAQVQRYTILLDQIERRLGEQAVWSLSGRKWLPAPDEIKSAACRIASPYSDVEDALAEVLYLRRTVGLRPAPHPLYPDRPNIRALNIVTAPRFSHPLLIEAIERCGGWKSFCTADVVGSEGVVSQFRSAYERAAERWEERVSEYLYLPVGCPDAPARWFPPYSPFEVPDIGAVSDEKPLLCVDQSAPHETPVPPPPELRRRIEAMIGPLNLPVEEESPFA